MIVSGISIWYVLLWAAFATIFYTIRYRKVKVFNNYLFKNPWTMVAIFAFNFFFFAWAAIAFVAMEWLRWQFRKKEKKSNEKK